MRLLLVARRLYGLVHILSFVRVRFQALGVHGDGFQKSDPQCPTAIHASAVGSRRSAVFRIRRLYRNRHRASPYPSVRDVQRQAPPASIAVRPTTFHLTEFPP